MLSTEVQGLKTNQYRTVNPASTLVCSRPFSLNLALLLCCILRDLQFLGLSAHLQVHLLLSPTVTTICSTGLDM